MPTDQGGNPAGRESGKPASVKPWQPKPWGFPWKWADAASASGAKPDFSPSHRAEHDYERQLEGVAREIGRIVESGQPPEAIQRDLRRYGELLEPWARQSAANMVKGVNRKNLQAWQSAARRSGLDMRRMLYSPGVGEAVRAAIDANIKEITGLAFKEADRVAELVRDSLANGMRAEDIAAKIAGSANISESRARVIARTEVSKAGTALTLARAAEVNSPGYIWRTARDGDTRDSHRAMEGQFVPWDKQPVLDGMKGHAGEFPNCRCYPEPVIPNENGGLHRPALPTTAQEANSGQKKLFSQWERQAGSPVIAPTVNGTLPNAERPVIDVRGKLAGYSLNQDHPVGGHKARALKAALDLGPDDAEMIAAQIRARLPEVDELAAKGTDGHGTRFGAFIPIKGNNGRTVDVWAGWIYDLAKDGASVSSRPRLASFYLKGKK